MSLRIGIDLGGTKIAALALAPDGRVAWRARVATPQGDYAATVAAVAALVTRAEADLAARGEIAAGARARVGIGHPGSLSPASGLLRNANSTCLNGRPLQHDLQALLQRELRLANDADCFALSEATDGAAAGAASVFGVILGTGVGGGLVFDGRLHVGTSGIAGEWGHNRLDVRHIDGEAYEPACWCGRRGCVETWLSGPALAADFARSAGATAFDCSAAGAAGGSAAIAGGAHPDAGRIVALAAAGDARAEAALRRYEARLAFALAQVVNVVDPQAIVLGGGLSNIARLYANVPPLLAGHVFSDAPAVRLLPPAHGDDSGVRGAARLWPAA